MKTLLLASAAAMLVVSSAGVAQTAAPAPKPVTRADYIKGVDARFSGIDTNHDGKLSREEIAAAQQRDVEKAKAAMAKQLQDAFKRLDTNHDGKLSLEEFMASEPQIRPSETPEQILQKYDTNHDGKISLEEFRASEVAKFNALDTNHDGVVTPQELQAAQGRK